MKDIIFLDINDVLEIHNIAIEKYGGQNGIRDYNLLDSAINQPRQTFGGKFLL
ncbi:MAG: Fic family protein [Candidatus Anammoxibacter sp.]